MPPPAGTCPLASERAGRREGQTGVDDLPGTDRARQRPRLAFLVSALLPRFTSTRRLMRCAKFAPDVTATEAGQGGSGHVYAHVHAHP
ncbi:hypothetical protein GGTG_11990 [Gaeumannomyces tritici R3-111a-1]|uniref:Uncharacterized protein n=1 Tax=Gaeumannomyces tritici (strain R3-111a-1) TaxID=644352 RepID=J3PEQ9_GAET3|nr:hypothetical protein GGTG_11990 [Gaeumannomyces tritici R3-111a-1]EJT70967.1 hypothetical protein GGTG_11990 [Gaeumannomyces tritici R3-111a-1]